ncbi:hypothetical protein Tco_1025322 [Tanacetum coccineum]
MSGGRFKRAGLAIAKTLFFFGTYLIPPIATSIGRICLKSEETNTERLIQEPRVPAKIGVDQLPTFCLQGEKKSKPSHSRTLTSDGKEAPVRGGKLNRHEKSIYGP